ncbi:MAG TPA: response regulator transcription factor [Pseudobacteroides sp.]|uniref:response regulator transcription factor n=1 Tax=Pseudobacteroides sp. TaxID=1968840 RepID=UPI002F94E761
MKGKLLVVEDDTEIARIMTDYLKRAGYEVNWASTGIEGLDDFKKDKYDLIIADIMMPQMDGFTLSKNIRMLSETPIIVVSAKHADEDKIKGFRLGIDDYLTKPFSLAELEIRIECLLKRYKKYLGFIDVGEVLRFKNGLTILPRTNQVVLYEQEIPLTAKEYALLKLMAENPTHVFTKRELYENIWNQSDVDGNNTVTVHVKALREKLGDDIKNPNFILTVWGTGYRFVGEKIT